MLRTNRDALGRLALGREWVAGAECTVALSVDMKLYDGPGERILPGAGQACETGLAAVRARLADLLGSILIASRAPSSRGPERWQSG